MIGAARQSFDHAEDEGVAKTAGAASVRDGLRRRIHDYLREHRVGIDRAAAEQVFNQIMCTPTDVVGLHVFREVCDLLDNQRARLSQ